jgi:hypothetical protein
MLRTTAYAATECLNFFVFPKNSAVTIPLALDSIPSHSASGLLVLKIDVALPENLI